ncbi:MAG: ABC transporter permease [Phycisphaerales bacterium]|nr:ABC transporter permease [Phycisphaerales bacterium]
MRAPAAKSMLHEGVIALLLILVMVLAAWLEPGFISVGAQLELSTHAFELALLALPMTFIIIAGGIDLSAGSTMALASVTLGLLHQAGTPLWLASAAAVSVGAAAGAVNGIFVSAVRIHPLIVTLATLAAYRGLAEGISLGRPVSGFPEGFQWIGAGTVLGVPVPVLVLIVAVMVAGVVLSRTVAGHWVYTIGGNELAARHCGVPVGRVQFGLYTLSGMAAGLAGVVFAARRNTAKADIGAGIELEVITAVVLGGVSIFGGRGTITGTVLGVALIHELRELVGWHWRRDELILIVIGVILVGSVLLNNLASRRRA